MLLNASQLLPLLQTNGKGAPAQVGFDLTVCEIKRIGGGVVAQDKTTIHPYELTMPSMGPTGKLMYSLQPGAYSLTFDQGIKLDRTHSAFVVHRSSVLRSGGVICSGVFDPSFHTDQIGAVLIAHCPLSIEKGARVAQIIMFENYEAEAYNGQWAGSKDYK